jgi:nanoRNase/pAp phosphatase (c-di-AMP/oligoRNAs hydrolase)
MESLEEIKKLVNEAKNICLIPSQHEPESTAAALALFYTLKELGKNVNLIAENIPETLQFLIPSLDFISSPKNFVISIPRNVADVSQVYYEKNEENLKIHLTIDKGTIKKEAISFYFADAKPDVTITLGIQDFQKELEGKLDSFGFLLDSPVINLDINPENKKFGQINIVENTSLAEVTNHFSKSIYEQTTTKHMADCLLTGILLHYENFQNPTIGPQVFELCANLMKHGANRQEILSNLYQPKKQEINFTQQQIVKSS